MGFDFSAIEGFEWDEANREKNWQKHGVLAWECEQVFFNSPLMILEDEKHSVNEQRWAAFGMTNFGRKLMIVFVMRKKRLRVISARDMRRKEREFYEKYK
jgi:uncharacterized DUF497 family protein